MLKMGNAFKVGHVWVNKTKTKSYKDHRELERKLMMFAFFFSSVLLNNYKEHASFNAFIACSMDWAVCSPSINYGSYSSAIILDKSIPILIFYLFNNMNIIFTEITGVNIKYKPKQSLNFVCSISGSTVYFVYKCKNIIRTLFFHIDHGLSWIISC